ncbi:MAG: HEPN domain-containing protein [Spirochaetales bacterium]|nr:HEPN domain-containing protein [Spirochaetales bacterium]
MSEEEYQYWLEAANLDQEAAQQLFAAGNYSACTFHCQQAVEKAFKACLYYSGRALFTHSLTNLAEELSKRLGIDLPEDILTACRELDFHYIPSRYPGTTSIKKLYTKEKAGSALEWMEECLSYVRALKFQ